MNTGQAIDEETIVSIPVEFFAHYQNGKITKFVVMPQESYAGYFGSGSHVWDGPEIEIDNPDTGEQSAFWKAVSTALTAAPNGITVKWEE